jgi:hypothetical protein
MAKSMDMAQDKAMIKKAVKQHDMQQHKGRTSLALKKGGPTSASMKAVGRNMARANNQRGR